METEKLRLVENSDNQSLFQCLPELENYYVDEVNGLGAEEMANYVPTRYELIQVVKHWYGRLLDDEFFRFQYGGSDSRECRIARFAPRRIRRAAKAIGQDMVDQAIKEVRDEFKSKINDPRLWNVFENGTSEQWDAVRNESWREIFQQYAAGTLAKLKQLEEESPGDFVALVLHDGLDEGRRPVLVSPTSSELTVVIQAMGNFEIETDVSKVRTLMVDQRLSAGFIRGMRQEDGDWRFEFPDSKPGTNGCHFLERVTGQIGKLLHAGKDPQPA
jgi:hypothetical protein